MPVSRTGISVDLRRVIVAQSSAIDRFTLLSISGVHSSGTQSAASAVGATRYSWTARFLASASPPIRIAQIAWNFNTCAVMT